MFINTNYIYISSFLTKPQLVSTTLGAVKSADSLTYHSSCWSDFEDTFCAEIGKRSKTTSLHPGVYLFYIGIAQFGPLYNVIYVPGSVLSVERHSYHTLPDGYGSHKEIIACLNSQDHKKLAGRLGRVLI